MFDGGFVGLTRLSRHDGVERSTEMLMKTGAVIIEDAAPREEVVACAAQLAPWYERAFTADGDFFGRNTKRFSGVFAKAERTADLAGAAFVVDVVERALKGNGPMPRCDAIQLNLTHAIGVLPGERAQVLHRDEVMFPFEHDYEVMINVMWPLHDWSPEMGATRLVPSSQHWPRTRLARPDEVAVAAAPAGSAVIWLGSLIHGAGANQTSIMRRGLAFSYTLGWLAQAERLLVSTPPEIARRLPKRVQRLIGYQLHKPNLGWIEERDPIEWLEGRFGDLAPAQDNLTPIQNALIQWRLNANDGAA
jgi:hypothetical protein